MKEVIEMAKTATVFLDELPGITRTSGTSKYAQTIRELDLDANPNKFALIEGPTSNHYGIATNLNTGKVVGVAENDYEFVARTLSEEQATAMGLPAPVQDTDKEGNPKTDDDGNPVMIDGYVFGRRIEGDVKTEVLTAREERKAKAAATREANGTTPGRKGSSKK